MSLSCTRLNVKKAQINIPHKAKNVPFQAREIVLLRASSPNRATYRHHRRPPDIFFFFFQRHSSSDVNQFFRLPSNTACQNHKRGWLHPITGNPSVSVEVSGDFPLRSTLLFLPSRSSERALSSEFSVFLLIRVEALPPVIIYDKSFLSLGFCFLARFSL